MLIHILTHLHSCLHAPVDGCSDVCQNMCILKILDIANVSAVWCAHRVDYVEFVFEWDMSVVYYVNTMVYLRCIENYATVVLNC